MNWFKKNKEKTEEQTKKEIPQFVTDLCVNNGFDYAEYLGVYKGWDIYMPCFYNPYTLFGRPCLIHVKGEKWRQSKSHSEVLKIIKFFRG